MKPTFTSARDVIHSKPKVKHGVGLQLFLHKISFRQIVVCPFYRCMLDASKKVVVLIFICVSEKICSTVRSIVVPKFR